MIADELRRQADVFIDLMALRSKVGRDPRNGHPRASAPYRRPWGQQVQRRGHLARKPGESDDLNP
jgi:hypothetical protein